MRLMAALLPWLLVLAVDPAVRAESVKCPRCADVGRVIRSIVAASYDACFRSGLAEATKPATVVLDVAKGGAVSEAKVTARQNLSAAQARCVVERLRTVKLQPSDGGVHIELALQFAPTPPPTPPPGPSAHARNCPPPGHWNERAHACEVSPCAGIPGGCRQDDLSRVLGVPARGKK